MIKVIRNYIVKLVKGYEMKTFSERLQELRREYGLNQVELAKRLGVSKVTISKYESNQMRPSIDIMIKIKQLFGKSLDWQLGFDGTTEDEYSTVLQECKKAGISPEKICEIIKVINK